MKYINIENGTWLIYDTENKRVVDQINTKEARAELEKIQLRLSEIPSEPTDEEYLRWARENMPKMDFSKETEYLQTRKQFLEETLNNVK